MIECAIPQDILKYKTKFIANFSVRETVCLGLGAMAGLAGYFMLFTGIEGKARIYASAIVVVPFLLFGFFKPLGQPLEKILAQIVYDNFICPPVRRYEIRRPEYEKYLKGEIEEVLPMDESDNKKSKKKKKKASKKKQQEKKVAKSKEFKAIK